MARGRARRAACVPPTAGRVCPSPPAGKGAAEEGHAQWCSAETDAEAKVLLSVGLKAIISQTLCTKASGDGLAAAFELVIATPAVKELIDDLLVQGACLFGHFAKDRPQDQEK